MGNLFIPVIGVEIEFYLSGSGNSIRYIIDECRRLSELFLSLSKEEGINQYEIKTLPSSDITHLINDVILLKEIVCNVSRKYGEYADFSAKPFEDMPGNALHVNLNLLDNDGVNVFKHKKYLLYAIAGLCKFMKCSMVYFAPHTSCYLRYQYPDNNTPTTISWGYNNRTTAIRVIAERIEHRVSSANSDVKQVVDCIVSAALYGMVKEEIIELNPIYGVAYHSRYLLEALPMTLTEARRHYKKY